MSLLHLHFRCFDLSEIPLACSGHLRTGSHEPLSIFRADSKEALLEKPWANGSCLHPPTEEGMGCLGFCSYPPAPGSASGMRAERERVTVKGRETWSGAGYSPRWCLEVPALEPPDMFVVSTVQDQEFKGLHSAVCSCTVMVLQFKSGKG